MLRMDVLIRFITVLVIHFFKFPQTNPDKQRWCNLIKRQDGKDGFKVTKNTFLCHVHFMETDIRKTINQWRLKKGTFPSSQLVVVTLLQQILARNPKQEKIYLRKS